MVLSEADLTQILLSHASTPDPDLQKRLADFYREVADMIEGSLRQGIAMNLVRPCNTRLTAYAMIGGVKEVVLQLTSSEEQKPTVEQLVHQLLEFSMAGILVKSQSHLVETIRGSGA